MPAYPIRLEPIASTTETSANTAVLKALLWPVCRDRKGKSKVTANTVYGKMVWREPEAITSHAVSLPVPLLYAKHRLPRYVTPSNSKGPIFDCGEQSVGLAAKANCGAAISVSLGERGEHTHTHTPQAKSTVLLQIGPQPVLDRHMTVVGSLISSPARRT